MTLIKEKDLDLVDKIIEFFKKENVNTESIVPACAVIFTSVAIANNIDCKRFQETLHAIYHEAEMNMKAAPNILLEFLENVEIEGKVN